MESDHLGTLRWTFRFLVGANALLFLVVLAAIVYALILFGRVNNSLCSFRADLEQRVAQTNRFLAEHPGPEPFPGVSRATVIQSRDNQQRTVDSLSDLNCG